MVKLMLNQWDEVQLELKGMLGVDAKFKELWQKWKKALQAEKHATKAARHQEQLKEKQAE